MTDPVTPEYARQLAEGVRSRVCEHKAVMFPHEGEAVALGLDSLAAQLEAAQKEDEERSQTMDGLLGEIEAAQERERQLRERLNDTETMMDEYVRRAVGAERILRGIEAAAVGENDARIAGAVLSQLSRIRSLLAALDSQTHGGSDE